MFEVRIDFAECLIHLVGNKNWIVAEAARAARRESQRALHFAQENLLFALGHGERQCADEFRRIILRVLLFQFAFDTRHRSGKVFALARPARGVDARRAGQRRHAQPRIIRQRRQAAGVGGGAGFQQRVAFEGEFGFFRLRQTQFARAFHIEAEGRNKLGDLAQLALVVRSQNQ